MVPFPGHCLSQLQHRCNLIKDGAIPVVFQDCPSALNWVVLTVVRRIIRQAEIQLITLGKLDNSFHELSAARMIFWAIILVEQQGFDLTEALLMGLPPRFEDI